MKRLAFSLIALSFLALPTQIKALPRGDGAYTANSFSPISPILNFRDRGYLIQQTDYVFIAYTADLDGITIAGTAVGFTASKVTPSDTPYYADLVTFRVKCSSSTPCPINAFWDGSTPTSSRGTTLNEGDYLAIPGHDNIVNFKAIRTTSNSAVLSTTYYRATK